MALADATAMMMKSDQSERQWIWSKSMIGLSFATSLDTRIVSVEFSEGPSVVLAVLAPISVVAVIEALTMAIAVVIAIVRDVVAFSVVNGCMVDTKAAIEVVATVVTSSSTIISVHESDPCCMSFLLKYHKDNVVAIVNV